MKYLLCLQKDIQNHPMKQNDNHLGHRERMQNKFLQMQDVGILEDYEFLELILMKSIPRIDVKPLAKELLKKFGSLSMVLSASKEELREFKYIKDSTLTLFKLIVEANTRLLGSQIKEKPVLEKWDQLIDYCCLCLQNFMVLYLDMHSRLLRKEVPQSGTNDRVSIYPREVLKQALILEASSVVVVHNHPSGRVQPSPADLAMTVELYKTLNAASIRFLDHLIIGAGRKVYSFSAHGHLMNIHKPYIVKKS